MASGYFAIWLAAGIVLYPPGVAFALLATQSKLQAQLDSLRFAKGVMPEKEYEKALEDLLTKIAENASELRALGARKP